VTSVKVGDNVCVQPIIYDETCCVCHRGLINCCDQLGLVGLSGWGGGLCEHVVLPASFVKLLPDSVPLEVGALVEPLAVGWHSVQVSPYQDGDCALVLGVGPIGLAVVLALARRKCQKIIVSAKGRKRKDLAKQFGAHHVIDPTTVDVSEVVKRFTNGEGVDIAFDTAGTQIAVDTALKAIKARGTLVNLAVWGERVALDMNDMLFGERGYMSA
jgi:threonine dehydrogenase-like Zn-dependent dehydrogenase